MKQKGKGTRMNWKGFPICASITTNTAGQNLDCSQPLFPVKNKEVINCRLD